MKRKQIIAINLLLLGIWIWVLMCFVGKSKLVEMGLDQGPFYSSTLWVMYFLSLLYAHFFVTRKLLLNFLVTTLLFGIAYENRYWPARKLLSYWDDIGDIWWLFQGDYLDLVTVNLCLLLSFEIARKLVPLRWQPLQKSA